MPTGPGPYRPPGAEPMEPPGVYFRWWEEVEACVGAEGDFSRVRWFQVPGDGWYTPTWKTEVHGAWVPPDDVYLAGEKTLEESLVKHEIVHELLDGGDLDDPRFLKCSGLGHNHGVTS